MESFYGGQPGKDFKITEIFFNKSNDLKQDLAKGWSSPIAIGDYVLVTYGVNDTLSYQENKQKDQDVYQKNYNGTLWKKIYGDINSISDNYLEIMFALGTSGLAYILVANLSGAKGQSGVYVGVSEPKDNSLIWINPYEQGKVHLKYRGSIEEGWSNISSIVGPPGAQALQYSTTLSSKNWKEYQGDYIYLWPIPQLKCGVDGNVSPIIYFTNNQPEYSKILKAEGTPKNGIVFYVKEPPISDIGVLAIDFK